MVYLFVAIALFALSLKGYCGKKTSHYVEDPKDALLFNIVRLILCMIIGFAVILFSGDLGSLAVDGKMTAICVFAGVCQAAFLGGWMLAIRQNSMVVIDVALTIGSILPAILCSILFGDPISPLKMIGFALILAAVVILAGYNRKIKGKIGFVGILLIVIAAAGDGLSSFSQQLYRQYYAEGGKFIGDVVYPKETYNFYIYIYAAVALIAFYFLYSLAAKKGGGESVKFSSRVRALGKPFPYILVMAICLFAATYFQTVATNDYGMSSQVLYPIMKGGCLILVNFMASLFFGEKMTVRSWVGSGVAFAGMVMMNVL